ncbi:MAG TPA: ABC transporter ATP-binding protein [Chitinivibrionales bacterium]|nr:ABC transporter ATP-binding protein [Chitinivibrionales bacterium]
MNYSIEIKDLYKNYSGEKALDGVSFNVPHGCLFGLIGADGAGKSTLMRILTTLIDADKGEARVLGMDAQKDYKKIRTMIGYMPQKFSLYPDLSVEENLTFFADIFDVSAAERDARMQRLLSFARLEPFRGRRAANLSGGMKQKLALCCCLVHTPRVLFLDEPTTGVDPVSRKEFWEILRDLRSQGIAILFSTPYMDEAGKCDDLLLLDHGRVIAAGTPAALVSSFPYLLYRVESPAGSLAWPRGRALPQGIAAIYPSSGALHATCSDTSMDEDRLLSLVHPAVPAAQTAARIRPGIEDAFIYHLSTHPAALSAPPVGRAQSPLSREGKPSEAGKGEVEELNG